MKMRDSPRFYYSYKDQVVNSKESIAADVRDLKARIEAQSLTPEDKKVIIKDAIQALIDML